MRLKLILMVLLIPILLFSACQPTPENTAIVHKGDGRLEEIIYSSPAASEQMIDVSQWVETYTIPKLKCEINAQVMTPKNKVFPVYLVEQRNFDADFKDRIVGYFAAGAIGVRKTSLTKEDFTQQLIQVKRGTYMVDDNGGRWEPYEGQQQEIALLEERIRNAPPEVFEPLEGYDSGFLTDDTYAMKDGSRVYIKAGSTNIGMSLEKNGILQLESWIRDGDGIPGEPPGATIDVKISEDEARETVSKLVSDLGIKNMGIAETEKARIVNNYTSEILIKGWQVTLSRNDGDSIPVNIESSQVNGSIDLSSKDYVKRWRSESIKVLVDERGINSFYWSYPLEVAETMNENVSLLSFDEVKEKIKGYIKYGFSRRVEQGVIRGDNGMAIDKIVLTNVLVPMKDVYKQQMLAPAWLVYYRDIENIAGKVYVGPTTVFAVNAIDGSSIDLENA